MNKQYKSNLLLSKEDYFALYDYKYIWFLPFLIIFILCFAAASPLLKGAELLPIFLIMLTAFIALTIVYNILNKKNKQLINDEFLNKELINFDLLFLEENIKINKNNTNFVIDYKEINKIEEYETFYSIYTNNENLKVLPVSKEIGNILDCSDFIEFIFSKVKLKRKKVKKIHLRKQKAFITLIVFGILTFAILTPIIYSFSYYLFDYGRFGIR